MRERKRDDRDFDQTQLFSKQHGSILHRDYTAHFFRWSFARRLIKATDHVLDVGCGQEKPLHRILFGGSFPVAKYYCGVDLNPLKTTENSNTDFFGLFNFVTRWKELTPKGPFDVAVHNEVIEHMLPKHGAKLLAGCFALLKPGGVMLMSTPCYDGRRHAANHIHEYTVPELQKAAEKAGFVVERRFGTFMDVKHIKKMKNPAVVETYKLLSEYFDNDAMSNFFAPLFPDQARNNLWVCRKPGK